MNILVSVNSKFFYPLKILIFSLYKTQKCHINLYLIKGDLLEEEISNLNKLCCLLNINLEVLSIEEDIFSFINEKKQILDGPLSSNKLSVETYYRLFLDFLLPEEVDRILWLDADCIVKKDISTFYNKSFKNKYLIGCDTSDIYYQSNTPDSMYKVHPSFEVGTFRYLNAGVLLFNRHLIHKSGILSKDKVMSYINTSIKNNYSFFDQDILNFVFRGSILWENPLMYNYSANQTYLGGFNDDILSQKEFIDKCCILHYCCPEKPWLSNSKLENFKIKYWKYFEKELKKYIKNIGIDLKN